MKVTLRIVLIGLIGAAVWTCSLWEYEDESNPHANSLPETFLTIIASDTLFPVATSDSTWAYIINGDSIPIAEPDTLTEAISDIKTSQQELHWWGEDFDGDIVGYQYRWNTDADWTYTTAEKKLFFIPIRTTRDVFWFEVKAIDNSAIWDYDKPAESDFDEEYFSDVGDSSNIYDLNDIVIAEGTQPGVQTPLDSALTRLTGTDVYRLPPTDITGAVDLTPASIVLPVRNSAPEINFRFQSNPTKEDVSGDTSFTFPTRTFVWDLYDLDGIPTITYVYYALDDTCETCWKVLDAAAYTSYTLTDTQTVSPSELTPGLHVIYLKAIDIAGAESAIISFPDTNEVNEPNHWKVMPVVGDVLLVDDFPQDTPNNTNRWYRSVMDSVVGVNQYSVWEIGQRLPYSDKDVDANLGYFDNVIWYSAYTGRETYQDASSSINTYLIGGKNLFLIASELKDTSFVWFPLEDTYVINPTGRLWPGTVLQSQIDSQYDAEVKKMITIRLRAFIPDLELFSELQNLYLLPDPSGQDQWTGNPIMASMGRFEVSPTQVSGLAGLMTITLHDGYDPTLDEAAIIRFFDYLINEAFAQ
ncbi:MAG: hypothetical protein H8E14_04320 [Candidatus Marinimicrobia bacterium]|nr:hypothetical protein [Candidatus Neomarinimicrobiota bacterium]